MEPELVGREESLQALIGALDAAFAGRGQIVLLSGEPGIGKSVLAAALAQQAHARGAAVTWGRAWEFADAPALFPLWPCLRTLGIAFDQEAPAHADGQHAFSLWERVAGALAQAVVSAPQVWLLEDLHAADLGTLDLLTFLAQPLRGWPMLIVVTVRTNDPRLTERTQQRLTRMARDGLRLELSALSERDVARLTEATLGRPVPQPALSRLVELTAGNPLFVVECARAFRAAGGVEGTLATLPASVRQVVLDRVGFFSEATRHALACGAVLGRDFAAATLARMNDSLPARAIDTLLPALRSGLLIETKPGQFRFSHALVCDAIVDALGRQQRAALHARAQAALEALGDGADVVVERARHALLALGENDPEQAQQLADGAIALLEREGAHDRALQLATHVDELQHSGLLPGASPERSLRLAQIARAAGRADVRKRCCDVVIAAARSRGDGELLARAALLHAADVRPSVIDRAQVAMLEEARAALGDRQPALGCVLLARLATAMLPAHDLSTPMAYAREALARVRATGDAEATVQVIELAGWGLYSAALEERTALTVELLERALQLDDLERALSANVALAFHHMEAGDFAAVDRDTESALSLADEIGHPRHRWRALLLASARATSLGHFAESERYLTEVEQLAALVDDPALPVALAFHRLQTARLQRRDSALRAAFDRLDQALAGSWEATLMSSVMRATCCARTEDEAGTRAALEQVGSRVLALLADPQLTAFVAEGYALVGGDDQRRLVRDALAQSGLRESSDGYVAFQYEGTVSRLLGLLDASLGELAGAERQLTEALTLARERKQAPWVAQIEYELAKVLLRAGQDVRARALLASSARAARQLGMEGLIRSANTDGASASVATPSTALALEMSGEIWTIRRGAQLARVKDSRGIQLLARLVERPGEELHVLALASDEGVAIQESSAGELLDERARNAYRQRLAQLERELALAARDHDGARTAALTREQHALRTELARAVGRGRRTRHAGSATERARINVQRRIKDAIARIAEADESLGRFLYDTVSTGTYCCFRP